MHQTIQEPQRSQISQEGDPQIRRRRRRLSFQSSHRHVIRQPPPLDERLISQSLYTNRHHTAPSSSSSRLTTKSLFRALRYYSSHYISKVIFITGGVEKCYFFIVVSALVWRVNASKVYAFWYTDWITTSGTRNILFFILLCFFLQTHFILLPFYIDMYSYIFVVCCLGFFNITGIILVILWAFHPPPGLFGLFR